MAHLKTQINTITNWSKAQPELKGSQPRAGPTSASGTARDQLPLLNTDPRRSAHRGGLYFWFYWGVCLNTDC